VSCCLQIWRAPGLRKVFAPMELYRSYGGCHADISSVDWSDDSFWITASSKDLTARQAAPLTTVSCTPTTSAQSMLWVFKVGLMLTPKLGALQWQIPSLYPASQAWQRQNTQAVHLSG